jgi:hypothetical protein
MANKKISQLNPVVSLSNTDLFPVVQGAETKKAKIQDIKSYLPTATSAITGLLSYTDWTTFNNKQNALSFGNLTESTSSVLTITGGSSSVIGSGTSIQVKQASASQSGFLSSSDWSLFNSKLSALTLTTTGTSGPATLTGGNLLNIPQYLGAAITSINSDTTAAHTIQAASTGTDFAITTASGVTSIKLPTASASARGALSSTDWSTFNSKQNALSFGTLSETGSSVLTITGGTNSVVGGNVTINVTAASASTSGYLSSSNFTTFAGKQDAITLTTTGSSGPSTLIGNVLNIPQYGASISTGNLTESSSNILTITGGTNAVVGSGTTIAVKVANGSQDGYLKSSDWNTFNNKANSFTSGNLTESTSNVLTITGGTSAVIGSGVSITVAAANTSTDGYLKQSDWNTFNGKQSAITLTTTGTSGAATLVGSTLNIPQYSGGGSSTAVDIQTAFNALGGSQKGYNMHNLNNYVSNIASGPANQSLYCLAYHIPVATTITGVKWFQTTQGSYTASNYNGVALYSQSGGTITLVASSTNDGNIWKGSSNLWQSKAFSSTYSAAAGVYYLAFIYSSSAVTTAPQIGFGPNTNSSAVNYDFTNSTKLNALFTGQTSLPSSISFTSGSVGSTTSWALFLY